MIKRKKFGVSEAINQGLSDTIKIVENNNAEFRNTVVPLARIEIDPDNPRKLALSPQDIQNGLNKHEEDYHVKFSELKSIIELSKSIQDTALLHPIIVYKNGEKYRIVAGERRFLATLYLNKSEIEARVFNEKPTGFKQKLVQWFENNTRADLSLYEKIENIRALADAYLTLHPAATLSCDTLVQLTGLSKSQAANYVIALTLPLDIYGPIKDGRINSLKKVIEITKIKNVALRKKAIESCHQYSTLTFIQSLVQQDKKTTTLQLNNTHKRGRSATKVNMGFTTNKSLIKKMIFTCMSAINNAELSLQAFQDIDWDVYEDLTKAFKRLLLILETVEVTSNSCIK